MRHLYDTHLEFSFCINGKYGKFIQTSTLAKIESESTFTASELFEIKYDLREALNTSIMDIIYLP